MVLAGLLLAGCNTGPSDPYAAAEQSLQDGEPRTALLHISKALESNPDKADIRLLASEIAMALNNPDRAITELKKVKPGSKLAGEAKERLAEAYLAHSKLRMAKATLKDIPLESALAYRVAVGLDFASGKPDEAIAKLDKAIELYPDDAVLGTIDAQRMLSFGNSAAALKRLEPILAATPYVPEAHLLAGQIHLRDRSLDVASRHFDNVIAVRPAHQTAMLAQAAIARDKGDDAASKKWIAQASNAGPAHPVALYFTAKMAFDAGEVEKAHKMVQGMPRSFAAVPEVQRLEGFIASARGRKQTAIAALQRYLSRSEGDLVARRVLAENFAGSGEFENAWQAIAPVIDHPQADGPSLLLAARLAKETGRSDLGRIKSLIAQREGRAALAKPLRKAGEAIRAGDWKSADAILGGLAAGGGKADPVVLNNAASVKSKLGEHKAAVALARKALELAPKSPEIMDTLGWSLWQSGDDPAEARRMLTQARQLAPANREIADHWAAAHAPS